MQMKAMPTSEDLCCDTGRRQYYVVTVLGDEYNDLTFWSYCGTYRRCTRQNLPLCGAVGSERGLPALLGASFLTD